jgi:hypothetical protein
VLPQLERAIGICQDADLPIWFLRMATALGAVYTLAEHVTDAVPHRGSDLARDGTIRNWMIPA